MNICHRCIVLWDVQKCTIYLFIWNVWSYRELQMIFDTLLKFISITIVDYSICNALFMLFSHHSNQSRFFIVANSHFKNSQVVILFVRINHSSKAAFAAITWFFSPDGGQMYKAQRNIFVTNLQLYNGFQVFFTFASKASFKTNSGCELH